MKQIIKFFSIWFLLFITLSDCLAVKDCRFVENKLLIRAITEKIKPSAQDMAYIDYNGSVFTINIKDIDETTIIVPILSFDKSKIIKEATISVKIEGATSVNDVLDVLLNNRGNDQWSFNSDVKFLNPKNTYKYTYITSLRDSLILFVALDADDRIFYMLPPDGSFANLRVVVEGDGESSQSFVFQKNGELKPVNSTPSVVHAGFFENLLDAVRGYLLKQEGYARVLTDDSRDAKLKSE